MKSRYLALLFVVFSQSVWANHSDEKPQDIDALYERVKHDRVMEQKQNQQREATFIAERDQQARLLAQAKAQLAEQETKTTQLNATFQEQEKVLAELNADLLLKSG